MGTTLTVLGEHLSSNKKELLALMIPEEAMLNAKTLSEKTKLAEVYFAKFKREAFNQLQINPKIFECSLDSIYDALTRSLQYQLELGRECHIVPYNNKVGNSWIKQAKFQADYKGWLALARRSPLTENIDVQPVYENDSVTMRLGDNPSITHDLIPFKDRGKLVGVYAIVWIRNSKVPIIEVMDILSIEKIRTISKQSTGNAWTNHYTEMARKTVLHKILKRAPREIRKNVEPVLKDWEENFEFSKKPIIEGNVADEKKPEKLLPVTNPTETINAAFDVKEKEKIPVDTISQDEKDEKQLFGDDK